MLTGTTTTRKIGLMATRVAEVRVQRQNRVISFFVVVMVRVPFCGRVLLSTLILYATFATVSSPKLFFFKVFS